MTCGPRSLRHLLNRPVLGSLCLLTLAFAVHAQAQSNAYERTFPQPKTAVEKALKAMQPNLAGRLPVLEGFATPGDHPLDRYERGYFQTLVQVTATASGGSLVRVSAKVTAWYADPVTSRSGYQLLLSNGRLEADVLDQLSEQLASVATERSTTASVTVPKQSLESPTAATPPPSQPATESAASAAPSISAPAPNRFPETGRTLSSSLSEGLATTANTAEPDHPNIGRANTALQADYDNLAEILKNQGHPRNLVAVKKSGTPVVATPSLTAKPQFLASMHDEFELLDFNADWVHVRISGLSRGWIWRNSVEMPDGIPDTDVRPAPATLTAADLFRVTREETAPFPGDWSPLRSKNVKIISVQKTDSAPKDAGPKERLEYAKFLLEKSYRETTQQKAQDLAGIVVVFDSADGGMLAATMATLQQWRAGTLSDSALWHQCFFDPPETFDSAATPASP